MKNEILKQMVSECNIEGEKVCINKDLHDFIKHFKDNYSYKMLKSITAVDLGEEIELLYNLYSIEDEESAIISVKVKNEAESVTDLFESAKADENEIYDMFGIKFIGNEDLKRLYMPENWEGYPLRKDYVQNDSRLAWNDNGDNA